MKMIAGLIGSIALGLVVKGVTDSWWGFGIAAAIAVVVVMMVISNRAPATATGAEATPPAPQKGGKQPDRWVQVFENVGGILSLVVFGGLVFAAIGLVQECGHGVSAELDRLHETVNAQASTQPPTPTTPRTTPTVQPLGKSPTGDPIYPTGTVLHFVTNGNCGKWKLRIVNAEWQTKEKSTGKELVQWFSTTDKDLYWTLSRDGWIETTANGGKGCQVQAEISR